MSTSATAARATLTEQRLVMVMVDLAGFSKAIDRSARCSSPSSSTRSPLDGRRDRVPRRASDQVHRDGCLAVFDESDAVAAVSCVGDVVEPIRTLGRAQASRAGPWRERAPLRCRRG